MAQKLYLIKFIVSYCCLLALNFSSIFFCIEIVTMKFNILKWIVNIVTKMKPYDSKSKYSKSYEIRWLFAY